MLDARVDQPAPGTVRVTVLSHSGGGAAGVDLIARVHSALNAERVRPVSDADLVIPAEIVPFQNEIPMPSLGGNYSRAGAVGEYTLFLGNVVTIAGHKRIAGGTGHSTGAGARTTGDVPGVAHDDTVNLYGYDVKFGNHVARVASLASDGGALTVVSGRLTIDVASDALTATVRNCGQLWVGAMAPGAVLNTDTAGRIVFTGAASGHDLTVAGVQTEILLGADHSIAAGKRLDLRSPRSLVGWDGAGNAALTLDGTLRMASGMTIETSGWSPRMAPGSEFRCEASGFRGVVEWVEHIGRYPDRYHIHLRDLTGAPVAGETFTGTPIRQSYSGSDDFDPDVDDHDDPQWNPTTIPTGTINSIVSVAMPRIAPFVSGVYGASAPTVAATVALSGAFALDLSRTDAAVPVRSVTFFISAGTGRL